MSNGLDTETEQKTVGFRTKHSEWVMAHDHRRMEKCLEVRLMEFYKVEINEMAFQQGIGRKCVKNWTRMNRRLVYTDA